MNQDQGGSIVRRWGFYSGSRLAFGGVAYQAGGGGLHLRIVETQQHAHTVPLPDRIGREQAVRESVLSDVERALGAEAQVSIEFVPHRPPEHLVAKDVFGPPSSTTFLKG